MHDYDFKTVATLPVCILTPLLLHVLIHVLSVCQKVEWQPDQLYMALFALHEYDFKAEHVCDFA